MSDITISRRTRAARPERIDIGDDELVRNDIVAKLQGTCERTINRSDARGAPFIYVGGVKYRPTPCTGSFWRAASCAKAALRSGGAGVGEGQKSDEARCGLCMRTSVS